MARIAAARAAAITCRGVAVLCSWNQITEWLRRLLGGATSRLTSRALLRDSNRQDSAGNSVSLRS